MHASKRSVPVFGRDETFMTRVVPRRAIQSEGTASAFVIKAGAARAVVLAVSLATTTVGSHLILINSGTTTFGVIMLVATLSTLVPFLDLGVGAAIMTTVARSRRPSEDEHIRRVLVSSLRVLMFSAALLSIAAVAIGSANLWPRLLGGVAAHSHDLNESVVVCAILFACSLPLSIGNRILIGLSLTHESILCAAIGPIVALAGVLGATHVHYHGILVAACWPLGSLVSSALSFRLGLARLHASPRSLLARCVRLRQYAGAKIGHYSRPMLILSIAFPISFQLDRTVLSHVANSSALARYAVCAQLYAPAYSLLVASSTALWPFFAKRSAAASDTTRTWVLATVGFAAAAAVGCIAMVAAGPAFASLVSGHSLAVGRTTFLAFGVLLISQAIFLPISMKLNEPDTLRTQAVFVGCSAALNVVLSIALASRIGTVGPVYASAVCTTLIQTVPLSILIRRHGGAGRVDPKDVRLAIA